MANNATHQSARLAVSQVLGVVMITLATLAAAAEETEQCSPGDFSSDGDLPCTNCPLGRFSDTPRSTQCAECPADSSSLPGSSECAFVVPATADEANFVPAVGLAASYVPEEEPTGNAIGGDFNLDGVDDIYFSNEATRELRFGDGQGGFTTTTLDGAGGVPLATGDFNDDGILDIFVAGIPGSQSVNEVLIGNDQAGFSSTTLPGDIADTRGAAVGRFNNDDIEDVLVANYGSANELLLGNGQGSVFTSTLLPLISVTNSHLSRAEQRDMTVSVAVGDFNNDDNVDAFVCGFLGWQILIGNGQGDFSSTYTSHNGYANDAVVRDFDGDGNDDVFVAIGGNGNRLLTGDGNGGFSTTVLERGDASKHVTARDFTGDGILDVFVSNQDAGNELMRGNAQGGFTSTMLGISEASFSLPAVGDYNNDGHPDLFFLASREMYLSVERGGFTSMKLQHMHESRDATTGDFNSDGIDDVFVCNQATANEILLSDGEGGFVSTLLPGYERSTGATTGDFNTDGHVDVFLANRMAENQVCAI